MSDKKADLAGPGIGDYDELKHVLPGDYKSLLDRKLAACISLSGAAESHYVWKGKRERTREHFCWIKTRKSLGKKVQKAVKEIHPYDCPEIVTLNIKDINAPYLKWLYRSTSH